MAPIFKMERKLFCSLLVSILYFHVFDFFFAKKTKQNGTMVDSIELIIGLFHNLQYYL